MGPRHQRRTTECRSCGTEPREGSRFCAECGTPLTKTPDAPEYKQVTALFADVVRSMDIAAVLDAERLREIISELTERAAAIVQRYGGGSAEYTGDGVMALFGAPVALEDHAFRACLAALEIQRMTGELARDVASRDHLSLQLRVGLNSGRVIAGELGSGTLGYTATGEAVGFAERMQSAAPPGAVMLSESTAALVEHRVALSDPELVHIKNARDPVSARRLLGITPRDDEPGPAEVDLVGRRWEMAILDAMVDRAIGGRGGIVSVVGAPGIGKSRVAREAAVVAAGRGVEVVWVFCESHTQDVPFYAATRFLRAGSGIADLDAATARARLRAVMPEADPQDLLLLDDILGVGDPGSPGPRIDPDARRRRLTALVNTASLARTQPALYIIEDAHWIDSVSESMLADFFAVVARVPSMVLITARPEYGGVLTRVPGAQTIALAPLDDSDVSALLGELLGAHPSIGELTAMITERAAGNPFFAEQMARELVQRRVLTGERGAYVCTVDVADVTVPATVQAAIEARVDRLSAPAKRTLHAASVIGARFDAELLGALQDDPVIDELLDTELIDQVRFLPNAEYAFHHPLIRAVAYESQLTSDRAVWHRRLAEAIQTRKPGAVDENAALIAEHLYAAKELRAAYDWHMRAAGWSANRDLGAARLNWERARRIADALPADAAARLSLRIAPRTMLLATGWRIDPNIAVHFERFSQLCAQSKDSVSLAIGMAGLVGSHVIHGRVREASQLASEQMALVESSGDPTPALGLAFIVFANWFDAGRFDEILRWAEVVIEATDGDPTRGAGFGIGSPLAMALVWRGIARWWLNRRGWQQDLRDAVSMVAQSHASSTVGVLGWGYGLGVYYGVLRADDAMVDAMEQAMNNAEGRGDGFIYSVSKYVLGAVLLHRDALKDRDRGLELLMAARDMFVREDIPFLIPLIDLCAARERAARGDVDAALSTMRDAVGELREAERIGYVIWGAGVFVETLLRRGEPADLREADQQMAWLSTVVADGFGAPQITLLKLRSLAALAHGDHAAHRDLVNRYRAMAELLGFEGHRAWAEAM